MSSGEAAVEMLPEVLDYLGEQRTLTLATASPSGVPHAGTFLYVHDGPELYFWTKAHTTTARHIEQNPLVSFTIDGSSDDLEKIRGLQGMGECRVILSGEQIARVADLFGQKFPALSPGTTMTISFFRIVASELQFTDNTDAAIHQQEGTFGVDFHRERAYSVFATCRCRASPASPASCRSSTSPRVRRSPARAGRPTSSSSSSTARSRSTAKGSAATPRCRSVPGSSSASSRSCATGRGRPP